ncbi:MAG: methylglyoxal synthase [Clostridiales bacterium]|nr:methylglyoxal synthase [Clostridiales bacterium]
MNLVLVANDTKKVLMQNFCIAYRNILKKHTIFSTDTTAYSIEKVTNLSLHKVVPGILGGVSQLCSRIEQNEVDLVIFFRDPDIDPTTDQGFLKMNLLCDTYNVPFASSIATAELLIKALDRGDLDWREIYK